MDQGKFVIYTKKCDEIVEYDTKNIFFINKMIKWKLFVQGIFPARPDPGGGGDYPANFRVGPPQLKCHLTDNYAYFYPILIKLGKFSINFFIEEKILKKKKKFIYILIFLLETTFLKLLTSKPLSIAISAPRQLAPPNEIFWIRPCFPV